MEQKSHQTSTHSISLQPLPHLAPSFVSRPTVKSKPLAIGRKTLPRSIPERKLPLPPEVSPTATNEKRGVTPSFFLPPLAGKKKPESEKHKVRPELDWLSSALPNNIPVDENGTFDLPSETEKRAVFEHIECMISEADIRTFLNRNPDFGEIKTTSHHDVKVNPDLPPKIKTQIEEVLGRHRAVFATQNGTPPVFNGSAHRIKLKPNAIPFRCPKPRWTPARREFLIRWARQMLNDGGYEYCNGVWATRMHLALKPNKNGDMEFGVRPCGAYVEVNERIEKMPPNAPRMEDLVMKFAGAEFFFETDAQSAYFQIPLHEDSRDVAAVWTPLGLLRPTRFAWGLKNAGTVLQKHMDRAFQKLSDEDREAMANYADDITAGFGTPERLVEFLDNFLTVCAAAGITLKPSKTLVGFTEADFLGKNITRGTVGIMEQNLRPVAEMKPPADKSALRRVLGLFVQSRHLIPDYARHASVLTRLTGKVPYVWTDKEQAAFDFLREEVLKAPRVYSPDYSKEFWLDSDSSDFGAGGVLYQLDDDGHHNVIAFFSKSYDASMVQRPIYYKEAYAFIWLLQQARYYLIASPFPVRIRMDHRPLLWVKHAHKGPVTAWLMEMATDLDFKIEFLQGVLNVTADCLTRAPLINPGNLNLFGLSQAWTTLLESLPHSLRSSPIVWAWAGVRTDEVIKIIRDWRSPQLTSRSLFRNSPSSPSRPKVYHLALMTPPAEKAPILCAELILAGNPFCCLVPSDLIHYIPCAIDGKHNQTIEDALKACKKIVYLKTSLAWVVSGCQLPNDTVFACLVTGIAMPITVANQQPIPMTPQVPLAPIERSPIDSVRARALHVIENADAWIQAQQAVMQEITDAYGNSVVIRADGLIMAVSDPGSAACIVVPKQFRHDLIAKTHELMGHPGYKKVRARLSLYFVWPHMSRDIKRVVHNCSSCALVKAKRNFVNANYRAIEYAGCAEAYGIDFYGMPTSDSGMNVIMVVIDLFSRYVWYLALKDRKARTIVKALLEHIIFQRGIPSVFVNDNCRELVGSVVKELMDVMDCKQIVTCRWPQGNSVTERHQVFLGEMLRHLDEKQRSDWDKSCHSGAFAHNIQVNSTTGLPPFTVQHGYEARLPIESLFARVPDKPVEMLLDTAPLRYHDMLKRYHILREIAEARSTAERAETNARLNENSGELMVFKIGQPVVFYIPPASGIHERKGDKTVCVWKPKHLVNWRLGIVTKRKSRVMYCIAELSTGRSFDRRIGLISVYRPVLSDSQRVNADRILSGNKPLNGSTKGPVTPSVGPNRFVIEVDSVVAVMDDPNDSIFWIATVLSVLEDSVQLHYHGTQCTDLRTARFRRVYQTRHGKNIYSENPPPGAKPWTGEVPLDPSYFVSTNIRLADSWKLTAHSFRELNSFAPNHAVMERKRK